ncbi:MAG: ATP-binding protein, partial [Roseburia sp.]|nr:ATP-binding protein [Roseburia sp.]
HLPLDGKWICEAFLNVLENAVKYSKAGSKITLRMIKMTVFLRIEIEDEGIGIPKSEWHQIFKRFYRGKAKEIQETAGSGVGLYLAREIVNRHGGTLTVAASHNEKGEGSCFVFQLPY